MLGFLYAGSFLRKGHDKQTKLQWQGTVSHSDLLYDATGRIDDGNTGDYEAAMAAADNIDWDQL